MPLAIYDGIKFNKLVDFSNPKKWNQNIGKKKRMIGLPCEVSKASASKFMRHFEMLKLNSLLYVIASWTMHEFTSQSKLFYFYIFLEKKYHFINKYARNIQDKKRLIR